jgi:hypothetical protein
MKYFWTDCPKCRCHIAVNYSETQTGIAGSLRRWSPDRSINDGRAVRIARAELPPAGGFAVTCLCEQTIDVPAKPDAVSAEREGDLRVKLGE